MSEPTRKGGRDDDRRARKSALDALVREARDDLAPRVGDEEWTVLEDRIVARMVEGPRSSLDADVRAPASRARVIQIGVAVLAAAAAIALVVGKGRVAPVDGGASAPIDLTASSLRALEGAGEVRVGGRPVSAGHVLRPGDLIEADGARALLDRPRKVSWLLEQDTPAAPVARARVKSAGESLVLGLEDGAIEAQVSPVPSGEAFAVDIATPQALVRVAVHGTHLRVLRSGSRVVVDLTEGVVSIGAPPRAGSTYGTLVTAPSHVEFDAADLERSLRVDHAPASVRAPVALVARPDVPTGQSSPGARARAAATQRSPRDPLAPPAPATAQPSAMSASRDPAPAAASGEVVATPPRPPREVIGAAVRACAASRSRPENVRVTVSSTLTLKVAPSGAVESARFDPPLSPSIQACAAEAIYKVKIDDSAGRVITLPVDFSY